MSKEKHQSLTPATQWLKEHKIPFEERSYEYEEHGGTALAASACGIDHHHVIKTLRLKGYTNPGQAAPYLRQSQADSCLRNRYAYHVVRGVYAR